MVPSLAANWVSSHRFDVQFSTTSSDAELHEGRMFEHRPVWHAFAGPGVAAAGVAVRSVRLSAFSLPGRGRAVCCRGRVGNVPVDTSVLSRRVHSLFDAP